MKSSVGGPGKLGMGMQIGQHVIAALLIGIGVARALMSAQLPLLTLVGLSLLMAGTYTYGAAAMHASAPKKSGRDTAMRARLWLAALTLTWVLAIFLSPEFIWVAFLLWLLAGHLLPGWFSVVYALLVYAGVVLALLGHHGAISGAGAIGPLVGALFALGLSRGYVELLRDAREKQRLVQSLRLTQQEMADLQDELALTQRHAGAIAERTRISRDIHDTVAQSLSSIRLMAHAGLSSQDPKTLGRIEELAQESLGDVRRIVAALAPTELEDDALSAALARMLERLSEHTGIRCELRADEHLPAISAQAETALLRTAQSALANVRSHSGAHTVVLSLIDAGDTVRMDVIDDGVGFDATAWRSSAGGADSSYGLRFMRSRLRELGGGLDVESTPGEGTALSAYLPAHTLEANS